MSEVETKPESAGEPYFEHTLVDGTVVRVSKPRGVIRMRLRALLGEAYSDAEMQAIGTAFLSITNWNGAPSPLQNSTQFEAMMCRFSSEEDLDFFMEKFQKLRQPELSRAVALAMEQALERGLNQDQTAELIRQASLPFAKARIERLKD